MKVKMVMPQMGESIAEGTIAKWLKDEGDTVEKDENILEISTDKVDSEIPSPATGRIAKLLVPEGETVDVGTVIAEIETDGDAPQDGEDSDDGEEKKKKESKAEGGKAEEKPKGEERDDEEGEKENEKEKERKKQREEETARAEKSKDVTAGEEREVATDRDRRGPARDEGGRFLSPLVRSMARESGVPLQELENVSGSGRGGRITKKDFQAYLEERKTAPSREAERQEAPRREAPAPAARPAAPFFAPPAPAASAEGPPPAPRTELDVSESRDTSDGRIDVVPMDNMRKKIAEHMVRSKATSPHVYSVIEADMTRIVYHRETHKAGFQSREGFKLTYTPYFVDAVLRALRDFPLMNASVEENDILVKRFVNIGIAVALDDGLIVPVIRKADSYNFIGLARAVNDVATRARAKKLTVDDIQGGTFTVTNMGGYGTLYGIPIINQPQVGILGIGTIQKRPVVTADHAIAIRDMVYMSLSYDHRLIDGAMAGQFLARFRWELENADLPRIGG